MYVCNLTVFLQFGLSMGKRQTNLLIRQFTTKLCSPAKSGPGIVKSLQLHIPMSK